LKANDVDDNVGESLKLLLTAIRTDGGSKGLDCRLAGGGIRRTSKGAGERAKGSTCMGVAQRDAGQAAISIAVCAVDGYVGKGRNLPAKIVAR
jgi:hypothetical protein